MRKLFALLVTVLLAAPGFAHSTELIRVSGQVGWSCYTGNGGFEPICEPDVEPGTFSLTYDPSTVDSDPREGFGWFDAIRSFKMTIEQTTRPDLVFTSSGGTMIREANDDAEWLFLRVGGFFLGLLHHSIYTAAPDEAPTIENFWRHNVYGLYGDAPGGVQEHDWLYGSLIIETINVPEPPVTLLLAIGLLALVAGRRMA